MKTHMKSSLLAVTVLTSHLLSGLLLSGLLLTGLLLTGFLLTGCESKQMDVKSTVPAIKTIEADPSLFDEMENGIADYKRRQAPAETKGFEGLLNEPQYVCGSIEVPKYLKELNRNEIYASNVSLNLNASLQAYGFSGTMGKKDVVIVAYLTKFKDYTCDSVIKRAQVGLKLYVHASDIKVKVASPSLGIIAAATELGLAKAEYRFETFGINPDHFYTNLPSAQFTVDTYSKVISAYDNIVHSLNDSTAIDPIVTEVSKRRR
jgi:hypothetical protein